MCTSCYGWSPFTLDGKKIQEKRVLKRASTLSACRLLSIDPWFSPRWKINWNSASINTVWKLGYYLWMCSQGLFINCRWKLKGGAVSPCVHFTWYTSFNCGDIDASHTQAEFLNIHIVSIFMASVHKCEHIHTMEWSNTGPLCWVRHRVSPFQLVR
jgi:hypothetical protein